MSIIKMPKIRANDVSILPLTTTRVDEETLRYNKKVKSSKIYTEKAGYKAFG
jgi:hypothetical protein